MAVNETTIHTPPERVFAVLSDADQYGHWVVGSSRVRDADAAFPAPGTKFHHTQGVGPVGIKDDTQVLSSEPPRRLKLHVRARPMVRAHVTLDLTPVPEGTHVRMEEVVVGGLGKVVPRPLNDAMLKLRNAESLRRLRKLAEEDPEAGTATKRR